MKTILDTAKKEYDNIASNQDETFKTCDSKEKLVDTLKCFYVNARKKKNQYDVDTLNEIEKIKKLVRSYPPITKIQSKYEIRRVVLKDQKGNPFNVLGTPSDLLASVISKGIG